MNKLKKRQQLIKITKGGKVPLVSYKCLQIPGGILGQALMELAKDIDRHLNSLNK